VRRRLVKPFCHILTHIFMHIFTPPDQAEYFVRHPAKPKMVAPNERTLWRSAPVRFH
jgi:hypothetical protein